MDDSKLGGMKGKGEVNKKKQDDTAKEWGKLPDKKRAAAMLELSSKLPPKYRNAVKEYYRQLEKTKSNSSR